MRSSRGAARPSSSPRRAARVSSNTRASGRPPARIISASALRIGAIGAGAVMGDRARSGVERDIIPRARLIEREAAGEGLARPRERLLAGGIEHEDGRLRADGEKGSDNRRSATPRIGMSESRVWPHPRARDNFRRRAASQDPRNRPKPRFPVPQAPALSTKSRKRAQPLLVEVARAGHVEARRLQGLRDQAGVIGGGRERALYRRPRRPPARSASPRRKPRPPDQRNTPAQPPG